MLETPVMEIAEAHLVAQVALVVVARPVVAVVEAPAVQVPARERQVHPAAEEPRVE